MQFNIITFHSAHNHGAVLQAYALQSFIEELGYSVGIYNYESPGKDSWRGKLLKNIKLLHKTDYKGKAEKFETFIKEKMKLNFEKDSQIFITGSDQVWNPTGLMDPAYFLQFISPSSVKASYAASIGVSHIPKEKQERFKHYIKEFKKISVREDDVKKELSTLYAGDISVNVDPTLLFDKNFWEKEMLSVEGIPEKYIFVYALKALKNLNELIKWLQKELNVPVVLIDEQGMIGYQVKHNIVKRDIGPREFICLIAHAEAVISTSFHGTVFSVLFEKEFYSIVNSAMPSRISNLLQMLNLPMVDQNTDTFTRNNKIDWESVRKILEDERKKSAEYFNELYSLVNAGQKKNVKECWQRCMGCSACTNVCPTHAITMEMTEEGFYQAVVDEDNCISCGRCLKTCPALDINNAYKNVKSAYCGWSKNEELLKISTSGAMFRVLANKILRENGVVYGAAYSDDYRNVLISSSDECDIEQLQKSKYVCADVGESYCRVKNCLKEGRKVLYVGTPCLIAGLQNFLGNQYSDSLITCDFVCGGVPSNKVYQDHLNFLEKRYKSKIASVDFRPKEYGWGKSAIKVAFENGALYVKKRGYADSYYNGFAREHINVREICLNCPFAERHTSDITLADFWGYKASNIKKNEKGMSLVTCNSIKGEELLMQVKKNITLTQIDSKLCGYAFKKKNLSEKQQIRRNGFFSVGSAIGYETASEQYIHTKTFQVAIDLIKCRCKRKLK